MMTRMGALSLIFLILGSVAGLHAQPTTVSYLQENDGGWQKFNDATDRYYSHGVGLNVTHRGVGYLFAHKIHTPQDLRAADPPTGEPPYAGHLFVGLYLQRSNRRSLDHLQVDLGVIGPLTRAEEVQRTMHERWGGTVPMGWDSQLGNAPTVQLLVRRKGRFGLTAHPLGAALQLIPAVEGAVGNVRRAVGVGTMVRAGFNIPRDFGPPRLDDLYDTTAAPTSGLGAYGFLRVAGRLVEHNLLLSGVSPLWLVGEWEAGAVVHGQIGRWRVQLGYSQTVVSPEFLTQRGPHAFGATTISVVYFRPTPSRLSSP